MPRRTVDLPTFDRMGSDVSGQSVRRRRGIRLLGEAERFLEASGGAGVLVSGFLALRTREELSRLLGYSVADLIRLIYRTPEEAKYTSFKIPKRRGGERSIAAPGPELKRLQQRLSVVLYAVHKPRFSAHGFLPGRGIATNAAVHVGSRYVCNVDLADFFGSINFGRIRGIFLAKPFELPESVATVLAQICCHRNVLPQGAPTSPVVSNMVATMLDRALERLAKAHGCRYTRYADDLTFSTNSEVFPKEILARSDSGELLIGGALSVALQKNGFRPNRKKVRLSYRGRRQEVTGLIVNTKVNVRREYIRQLRAMIHAIGKFGDGAASAEHYAKYSETENRFVRSSRGPKLSIIVEGKLEFLGSTIGKASPVYLNLLRRYRASMAPRKASLATKQGQPYSGFGAICVRRRLNSVFGQFTEADSLTALLAKGRELYLGRNEQRRRERFPELDKTCAEVAQALEAVGPSSLIGTSIGRIYDFTGQPQLLARWEAAHDRVEAAVDAARPPLPVVVGDWVRLGAHLVRVTATDLRRRTALVELRQTRGIESASDWCKADTLVPVPHDTPAAPWSDPPEKTRDGIARTRFRMELLSNAIEQAGLTPDPWFKSDD